MNHSLTDRDDSSQYVQCTRVTGNNLGKQRLNEKHKYKYVNLRCLNQDRIQSDLILTQITLCCYSYDDDDETNIDCCSS